ncbi:MAG: DUF952 domain-containing protein [Balneolaceae bacterium]
MSDLIFYVLPSIKLKERQKDGALLAESGEREEALTALYADQVELFCNRMYSGQNGILLLVIQTTRLSAPVRNQVIAGEPHPVIGGPLNMDAIMDKIELEPNESGEFEVEISV